MNKSACIAMIFLCFCIACNNNNDWQTEYKDWTKVNGNESNNKYSSLTQIDTGNVSQLQVAWEFHTGDADTAAHSQIQCNPIIVDGVLYGTSPQLKVFALDAATGKQKWMYSPYDSTADDKDIHFVLNNNRGVTYWTDGKEDKRIFYTASSFLTCLDAITGKPISGFGNKGKIDLHEGLDMQGAKDLFVTQTSPPSVYKDLLICGARVSEGTDAAPGDIRAYNAKTGRMVWQFHTIPHPGEAGYDTWEDTGAYKYTGGANNWMGMTVDQQRGIAYIPIGSASMDFYGGRRTGSNLFADCMLALDAATGKEKWHFQYLHHDTWDYDPSSAPVLVTVKQDGKKLMRWRKLQRLVSCISLTVKTASLYFL